MSWRPEKDWDAAAIAVKEVNRLSEFGYTPSHVDLVEAGADAILEALKAKGRHYYACPTYESKESIYYDVRRLAGDILETKGWLVFIPEETE